MVMSQCKQASLAACYTPWNRFWQAELYEGRKVSVALASECLMVTAWACSAECKWLGYGCTHLYEVIILSPSDGKGEGV